LTWCVLAWCVLARSDSCACLLELEFCSCSISSSSPSSSSSSSSDSSSFSGSSTTERTLETCLLVRLSPLTVQAGPSNDDRKSLMGFLGSRMKKAS
ncbi:hypothetical protein EV426DRAFT_619949, partial [Tirmania nivea]